MAYTLQQLSDFEDIRTLKHRYFRGIDTADEALLRSLFTDDIYVEYRGGEYLVKLQGMEPMIDFLLTSFNSDSLAMHQGSMPELKITGDNEAEGLWYLEDLFVSFERQDYTIGTAIYRDRYVRVDGEWKIARAEYDRIMEIVEPLDTNKKVTLNHLAKAGRKPDQRTDIAHLITWFNKAA